MPGKQRSEMRRKAVMVRPPIVMSRCERKTEDRKSGEDLETGDGL